MFKGRGKGFGSDFDHLHLKRNTAGSSNELSFDVLDAARSNTGGKQSRASHRARGFGSKRESQGNYRGVAGTATISQSEIETSLQKRERRSHAKRLWALAIVIAVGAIGVVAYMGYGRYQSMQAFSDQFEGLVDQLVEVDACFAQADEIMAEPLSSNTKKRKSVADAAPGCGEMLAKTKNDVEICRQAALSERDSIALDQVRDAVDARTDMLEAAQGAIAVADEYQLVGSKLDEAWDSVLSADAIARMATKAANEADTENEVSRARDATAKARGQMKHALKQVNSLTKTHASLDLSRLHDYLKIRVEALDHAVATSDALLAGDIDKASLENEAYNTADERAAKLAKKLSSAPRDAVQAVFSAELEPFESSYEAARDKVIEADSLIRAYRG